MKNTVTIDLNDAAFLARLVSEYLTTYDTQIHPQGKKHLGNLIVKLSEKVGC